MFLAIFLFLSTLLIGGVLEDWDLSIGRLLKPVFSPKKLALSIDAAFSMDAAMSWTLVLETFKDVSRSPPFKLLR
jgi:hypothetical protein